MIRRAKRTEWTPDMVVVLKQGYANGDPVKQIAKRLGLTEKQCTAKASQIYLKHPNSNRPHTREPDEPQPTRYTPSLVDIPALRRPMP